MKTNLFVSLVLSSALSVSVLAAADFSKNSNQSLIDMAGNVAPKDYPDYKMEVHKRMQKMTKEEAKDFKDKMRTQSQKVNDTRTLKEFRERKEAIAQAIEEKTKNMTPEELQKSGLAPHKNMGKAKDKKDKKRDWSDCGCSVK